MRYERAIEELGRDDVTATFAVSPPQEIVGPLNVSDVFYGKSWGYPSRSSHAALGSPIPMVTLAFNKYRSDLPPWDRLFEFVLASEYRGVVRTYSFIDANVRSINTTGELKTVDIHAEFGGQGIDACAFITRDRVAEDGRVDP